MFVKGSCEDFVKILGSDAAVPGGGGAAALVGAIGAALGNMVAALTVGKKKYADVESEMLSLINKANTLQSELLELVEKDAIAFEPLSKAYGLPKATEEQKAERKKLMEEALRTACSAPLEIMEKCCVAIDMHREFAAKGSVLAISDAGVGVEFCKAALKGASLNVFINTKLMSDREYAEKTNRFATNMLDKYTAAADEIFESVFARLR